MFIENVTSNLIEVLRFSNDANKHELGVGEWPKRCKKETVNQAAGFLEVVASRAHSLANGHQHHERPNIGNTALRVGG